ncbi:MAG: glycosyltransferase family 4 protein, partial [Planctomycetes bacterium]|nr:glycosyltransferase family 4 protein [Planctomycetota bacterium]
RVFIYAKAKPALSPTEVCQGVTIRRIPVRIDRLLRPALHRLSRLCHPLSPFFSRQLYYPLFYRQAILTARADRCDLLHIHNFSQYVPLARRLHSQAKIVLHMHCDWLWQLSAKAVARSVADADAVVGCSEYITDGVRRRFALQTRQFHTVLNGVDFTTFKARAPADQPPHILFVGRLTPEKGVHVLIEAFRRLASRWPEAKLDIVGGGGPTVTEFLQGMRDEQHLAPLAEFYRHRDYPDWLRQLADTPQLRERVRFLGPLPQETLADVYRQATLLAHPPLAEPFGMVVAEAMAAGLPVVATRVGGLAEVVQDGSTGLLVPPADPKALAKAIGELLADPDTARRFAAAGRLYAQKHFNWDHVTNQMREVYRAASAGVSESLTDQIPGAATW